MANLTLKNNSGGETSITADNFIGNASNSLKLDNISSDNYLKNGIRITDSCDNAAAFTTNWVTNEATEKPEGITYGALLDFKSWYSNHHQIFLSYTGNDTYVGLYTRARVNEVWQPWSRYLNEHNYTAYTVTKTGSGASGTWGISISGNAVTATQLATARTFQTNLSSNSATSFNGTANITLGVTGILSISNGGTGANTRELAARYILSGGTKNVDYNTLVSSGFYWIQPGGNTNCVNYPEGCSYGYMEIMTLSDSSVFQRVTQYNTGDTWVRTNINGWQSWVKYLTSTNYSAYALPLTGGTVNGTINIDSGYVQFSATSGGLHWNNADSSYLVPNNYGSYGNLAILGAKGNYCGLHLGPNSNGLTIMDEFTNHEGLYDGLGWVLYRNKKSGLIGINTANLGSYTVTIDGTLQINGSVYTGGCFRTSNYGSSNPSSSTEGYGKLGSIYYKT